MPRLTHSLILLLLAVLIGCSREAPPAPAAARQAITLALPNHPTSALVLVALDRGLFARQGLDIQVQHFPSGKRAIEEGLLARHADLAVATDTPVALAALQHPNIRVLASIMSTDSVSRIVARRDLGIDTPADLRGKPIATQAASSVHFFLHQFLLEQELSDKDVKLQFRKIEDLPDALVSGQVAAISTREPYISQCRAKLGDRLRLFSARGLYQQIEMLLTTEAFLRAHPAVGRGLLAALLEAEAFADQQPAQVRSIVARRLNMTPEAVAAILPSYDLRVELPQSLLTLLEDETRWAVDNGLATGPVPDFLTILSPQALTELAPERVTLIR